MKKILFLFFFIFFLVFGHDCLAGPPFLTDDPEPVDYQHWEFYLSSQHSITQNAAHGTAPHFEINYGIFPNFQFHIVAPMAYIHSSAPQDYYGYGDTEIGIKYRFIQESDFIPMVGIFPLVEIPTGDPNKGLGNGQEQYYLPIWIQKSFGDWSTYGGAGYWINPGEGNNNYWYAGWQIQKNINELISLGMEIYYMTPDVVDGKDRLGLNFGGNINFTENYHLLFSGGRDITGDNIFIGYIGFQVTL